MHVDITWGLFLSTLEKRCYLRRVRQQLYLPRHDDLSIDGADQLPSLGRTVERGIAVRQDKCCEGREPKREVATGTSAALRQREKNKQQAG